MSCPFAAFLYMLSSNNCSVNSACPLASTCVKRNALVCCLLPKSAHGSSHEKLTGSSLHSSQLSGSAARAFANVSIIVVTSDKHLYTKPSTASYTRSPATYVVPLTHVT